MNIMKLHIQDQDHDKEKDIHPATHYNQNAQSISQRKSWKQ